MAAYYRQGISKPPVPDMNKGTFNNLILYEAEHDSGGKGPYKRELKIIDTKNFKS